MACKPSQFLNPYEPAKGVWTVDVQFDATESGRALEIVSIVDEHTREFLGGMVECSIKAKKLRTHLDIICTQHGVYPAVLRKRRHSATKPQPNTPSDKNKKNELSHQPDLQTGASGSAVGLVDTGYAIIGGVARS